jgi:manganese oxidase
VTEERTMGTIATAVIAAVALVLSAGAMITAAGASVRAGSAPAPAASGPTAPDTVTVDLAEFSIAPSEIEIAAGGTLVVTNRGAIEHDLEVVGTGIATPMLGAGATYELSLAGLAPGTYPLHCTVPGHDSAGMTGRLVVVGDGAAPASTAGDPAAHDTGDDVDWAALDAAMTESILAYPAETEGRGNQLLDPEEVLADGTKVFRLVAEIIDWEVEPGKIVEGWAYNGQIPGPDDPGRRRRPRAGARREPPADGHRRALARRAGPQRPGRRRPADPAADRSRRHLHLRVRRRRARDRDVPPAPPRADQAAERHVRRVHHRDMGTDIPLPTGRTISGRTVPEDLEVVAEIPMVLNDAGTIGLTINGKGWPATEPIVVDEGDWFIVHYYNEGLQIHPMHLHQMPQLVVAKDGFALDAPQWEDTVNVAPGERYTVLVQATDPGRVGVPLPHPHPRRTARRACSAWSPR